MRSQAKQPSKILLYSGLFLSLGFSLSWSPLAISNGERALASETAVVQKTTDQKATELQSFDLEKIDAKQKGLKVFYEIDTTGSERRVRYYVEGTSPDACADCLGLGLAHSEPLKDQNVQNIELLNRMIGEMAISKITRKKVEVVEETKEIKKKTKDLVTSECEAEEEEIKMTAEEKALMNMVETQDTSGFSERLTCKTEEFQALTEECQETMESSTAGLTKQEIKETLAARKTCAVKIATYYNKFLKKDLLEGLSSKSNSQQNALAASFRDGILRNIPAALNGLKVDIVKVSQAGLLDRAKVYYVNQMATKSPTETAESVANRAKMMMVTELHGASNANFCSAFSGLSAQSCMQANTNPMVRASLANQNSSFNTYNTTYLSPLEKFAITQTQGTDPGFDQLIAQLGINTSGVGGGSMIDPNMTGPVQLPTGFYDARANLQGRGAGSATLLLPLPGSAQPGAIQSNNAVQGQVLLPQNPVIYQQPNQQPMQQPIQQPVLINKAYPTTPGQRK